MRAISGVKGMLCYESRGVTRIRGNSPALKAEWLEDPAQVQIVNGGARNALENLPEQYVLRMLVVEDATGREKQLTLTKRRNEAGPAAAESYAWIGDVETLVARGVGQQMPNANGLADRCALELWQMASKRSLEFELRLAGEFQRHQGGQQLRNTAELETRFARERRGMIVVRSARGGKDHLLTGAEADGGTWRRTSTDHFRQ